MMLSLYIIFFLNNYNNTQIIDMQDQHVKKVISKEEALMLLGEIDYTIDKDKTLDKEIAHYYFLNKKGYLIIYDFIDDAVLFKSKENYLSYLEEDSSNPLNSKLYKVFENSEEYINNLSNYLHISLSTEDNIEQLKGLDKKIFSMGLSNLDIVNCEDEIFAYFCSIIANELGNNEWKSTYKEEEVSFIIIDKTGKEYEVYKPLYKMLINQDENFSFFSLANHILYPFKLSLEE